MKSKYKVSNIEVIWIDDLAYQPDDGWGELFEGDLFLDDVTRGDAEYTLISLSTLYFEAERFGLTELMEECDLIREEKGLDILIGLDGWVSNNSRRNKCLTGLIM